MKKVEISLKEILVYTLRRWKIILLFCIVLSVLLAGYSYLNRDKTIELSPFDNKMVKLSIGINLVDYKPTSADSYHITLATNDILAKLTNRYMIIAQGAPLVDILKDISIPNIDENDLRSYIRVVSPINDILDVIVTGPSGIDYNKAAEAVFEYLKGHTEEVSNSVYNHNLSFLASSTSILKPSRITENAGIIKSALIGLLVGLIFSVIVAAFTYITRLPIQIPEQIQRQMDIKYLGGVRRGSNHSLANILSGTLRLANDQEAMDIISANINNLSGLHKQILVTGTIDENAIDNFATKLSLKLANSDKIFVSGGDINKNVATISTLGESDAVILVERIDSSTLKRVFEEKERIDMSGKEIIGYVIY